MDHNAHVTAYHRERERMIAVIGEYLGYETKGDFDRLSMFSLRSAYNLVMLAL
jgi:hypothetical protein